MNDFDKFRPIADRVAAGCKYLIRYCSPVMDYEDMRQIAYEELILILNDPRRQELIDEAVAAWAMVRIEGAIMNKARECEPSDRSTEFESSDSYPPDYDELSNNANPEKIILLKEFFTGLSPRDHMILEMLREGQTQEEIAAEIGLTPARVSQIVNKLRADAIEALS